MFRKVVMSAVSGVALASSAFAADIYSPSGVSYIPPVVPVSTWAGFYIGANGGYGGQQGLGFRNIVSSTATGAVQSNVLGNTDITGGFGGGQLGYNFQYGNFIFGVETDIQGSNIQGHGSLPTISFPTSLAVPSRSASADIDVDYFGTVRGRIGYSWGGVLLYGTGGFAYGGVRSTFAYSDSNGFSGRVSTTQTQTGWTAGGGIEYKISPSWSLKGEYQFIGLGSSSSGSNSLVDAAGATAPFTIRGNEHAEFNTVRVGVNYYFNAAYEPLPLK